jgi:hypothetical protein
VGNGPVLSMNDWGRGGGLREKPIGAPISLVVRRNAALSRVQFGPEARVRIAFEERSNVQHAKATARNALRAFSMLLSE